jgi:dolichol-phosphate mannosyltransferase
MMPRGLSIVMPAKDEAGNLTQAFLLLQEAANRAGLERYEIILVNDGSTDTTGQLADRLATQVTDVRVLHHPVNLGLKAAYESGLAVARYDHVWWVPGDGEIPLDSLVRVLHAYQDTRKDLSVPYHGTPEKRPWFRRALTWISTTQLNLLLGHRLHYYQGVVIYPTELARRLPRTIDGFFFAAEMLAHALEEGLTYVEVPLEHQERVYGTSKAVSPRKIWDGQMAVLRIWFAITARRLSADAARTLSQA